VEREAALHREVRGSGDLGDARAGGEVDDDLAGEHACAGTTAVHRQLAEHVGVRAQHGPGSRRNALEDQARADRAHATDAELSRASAEGVGASEELDGERGARGVGGVFLSRTEGLAERGEIEALRDALARLRRRSAIGVRQRLGAGIVVRRDAGVGRRVDRSGAIVVAASSEEGDRDEESEARVDG
jgi:hypothetical protein